MISASTMPPHHAISTDLRLSEDLAALLPPGWSPDVPLVRIRTCGPLEVEVLLDLHLDPAGRGQAVYGPPGAELFKIKCMSTALLLLALLASQPGGFASKDFLTQTLSHLRRASVGDVGEEEDELEEDGALSRLDNVVSLLRKLLCPPRLLALPKAYLLRKHLVRFVRATPESGPGYQLASFPLLWLDVEVMEHAVTRARQMEERGEDGLEQWQAASQIGMRGLFLAHEPYSEWADWRRGRVSDLLWQSVNAQCRRALQRGEDPRSLEAAANLLLDYWQSHPTHEDAFRSLLDLLGKQGRFPLAEECYRHLGSALEREGLLLQPRTQEAMARVRVHQREAEFLQGRKGSSETAGEASAGRMVAETRHLIGREGWLCGVQQMVQGFPAKKLLILQGPIGVGKSSELTRLAQAFHNSEPVGSRVIWLPFPAAEWSSSGPEAALDVLLATVLSECGLAPLPSEAPRTRLIAALLTHLEQQRRPTVILLDNAECLLEEDGSLAACWEAFLTQFVRSHHQASVLLATKEWQGWPGRETIFVAETFVPPLSGEESVRLLQRLGLQEVPIEHLEAVSARMAGIPLLLEWTAKLVADPLLLDQWESFHEQESILQPYTAQESLAERLQKILDDPTLLGEHLANRLAPLLQRILEKHLSEEARLVLARLAIATVPLGQPALQMLCPRPRLLKELRDASLLAAYTNRVQLLPVVALTVQQHLLPEQRQEIEDLVIQAYTRWLDDGNMSDSEAGSVVTELTVLLLTHHCLLEAAQLLIRCGWLSFKLGYGPRLASLAQNMLHCVDWHQTIEDECAGLVLVQILFPFLGKPVETKEYINYQHIRDGFLAGEVVLQDATEGYVTHLLLLDAMDDVRFEEAQAILDTYRSRLESRRITRLVSHTSLLQKQALLLGRWCEYVEEQGDTQKARTLREQAIALYRQRVALLSSQERRPPLSRCLRNRGLANCLSYLGYHLARIGQYEEALQVIERAIDLQEQGYAYVGVLAASYSDKSQILMELGRFQEAILFDEKAFAEIQHCVNAGDGLSQEEVWIYHVNRGRLYLRLGRVDEAERLLRDALPRIHDRRRMYRMFAKEALEEIEQWRHQVASPYHQLDWRWLKRYRELASYNSYWWLTWAGPFTEEEQEQWEHLSSLPVDETSRAQLGTLMKESRERELVQALAEQREPRLHYPAIAIEEVRHRVTALLELDAEIRQHEPNAVVRRLYQGAIEEEVDFLSLIEATYEGHTEQFWERNLRLLPAPTTEEMEYALSSIKSVLHQGLKSPQTAEISQDLCEFLRTHLHLTCDLSSSEEALLQNQRELPKSSPQPPRKVSAQTARRFFEAILQESGYEGWEVVIDPNTSNARIEQGLRHLFLPEKQFSLHEIRHLFLHELVGHVARCVAGEHSSLGLLGIHTKNSLPTEEGLALYHERQVAALHGQAFDDSGIRMGTLAVGLACGVMTPPQTFLSVCTFLESFSLLRRLLKGPNADLQKAQQRSRSYALSICLRTYRGVPDLGRAGVCYVQDAVYLRGLRLIERAVANDSTVLDRLAVGVCAVEQLPDLQELGILSAPQPLRRLAYSPDLDNYILSYEQPEKTVHPS